MTKTNESLPALVNAPEIQPVDLQEKSRTILEAISLDVEFGEITEEMAITMLHEFCIEAVLSSQNS